MHQIIFISLTVLTSIIANQGVQTASSPRPKSKILHRNDQNDEFSTPSPYWIAYQYERFGIPPQSRPQGLVVSTDHLPNSAQVVVPASSKPVQEVDELSQVEVVQVGTTPRKDMSFENYQDEEDGEATEGADNVQTENDGQLQFPSIQGFIRFLKSIKKTWLKNSKFNFEQKIQYLKNLRDTLMRKIEQQFNLLWPPETEHKRRSKRGLLEESSLNFPPQTAIMTINFLTFAVFLIKLVLQVVHIVRSKHYNFAGFTVNTETLTG